MSVQRHLILRRINKIERRFLVDWYHCYLYWLEKILLSKDYTVTQWALWQVKLFVYLIYKGWYFVRIWLCKPFDIQTVWKIYSRPLCFFCFWFRVVFSVLLHTLEDFWINHCEQISMSPKHTEGRFLHLSYREYQTSV